MPEQDQHREDPSLEAPPKLVEALKRLQQSGLRVPPQIDEAALSRARLHFSHVQQWQAGADGRALTAEELALDARSESSAKPWWERFGAGSLGSLSRKETSRIPWRKILSWATLLRPLLYTSLIVASLCGLYDLATSLFLAQKGDYSLQTGDYSPSAFHHHHLRIGGFWLIVALAVLIIGMALLLFLLKPFFGADSLGSISRKEPGRIPWRKILAWAIVLALLVGLALLLTPW